jgi:hypothetical protein
MPCKLIHIIIIFEIKENYTYVGDLVFYIIYLLKQNLKFTWQISQSISPG